MKNKSYNENQSLPLGDRSDAARTDALPDSLASGAEIKSRDDMALESRRNFIKKYGALAAITPVAMTLTLHSKKALASSCTECGP